MNPTDNLRIGVLLEGFDVCEPDVIKCIQKALKIIKSSHKFAAVEDVSVPMHKQGENILISWIIFRFATFVSLSKQNLRSGQN